MPIRAQRLSFDFSLYSVQNCGMQDPYLAAVVQAVAMELIELGYKPIMCGYVHRRADDEVKAVAERVWQAMNNILAKGDVQLGEREKPNARTFGF